jgi:predicted amidohydrolase
MKVAALQLDLAWEDPAANEALARAELARAQALGARLALLPELWPTGFTMRAAQVAQPFAGRSVTFMAEQAARLGLWIGGSVPELPEGAGVDARPHNTFVLAAPSGAVHRYRKLHPFTFAGEHEHYAAGDALEVVDIEGLRCALFVCYDLRFADEFWQLAPRVDAYLVVANWPARRRHHWSTLLRARAIENQAYVVGVNRVGIADGLEYAGDSAVFDPWGEALVQAAGAPTVLLAELDPAVVADARAKFPVLRDRR